MGEEIIAYLRSQSRWEPEVGVTYKCKFGHLEIEGSSEPLKVERRDCQEGTIVIFISYHNDLFSRLVPQEMIPDIKWD